VSAYGTFDQTGTVYEINDLDGTTAGSERGRRGSFWANGAYYASSSHSETYSTSQANYMTGFRLASPVAVPEPSTWVMGLAGIACAGWGTYRRRWAR
jgi:hypothetical protein